MENKQHITQTRADSPWPTCVFAVVLIAAWFPIGNCVKTLWLLILAWIVWIVIGAVLWGLLSTYLFLGDIVLSPEGIRRTRRLKTKDVPWNDIIQAIAMEYGNENVLVLVKRGGYQWNGKVSRRWFFFRNPAKIIFLPDDQFTRRFVADYYGPLDFDQGQL